MDIKQLIQKYEENREYYLSSKYNEAQLRADFLDPLFEALGWDIQNKKGKSHNEREVLLEESLKKDSKAFIKKPDYTFRLFSERKFFLEAKKPSVNLITTEEPAKQIRRYGYTAKLKISVLSNFEHLIIYDCSEKVNPEDDLNKRLIRRYHYSEYAACFDQLKKQLGKSSVYSGGFDKAWKDIESNKITLSVDKLFLHQINEWRNLLGIEIIKNKQDISEIELNDIVQSYLNSIIFLRVCEDRNLEQYKTLSLYAEKQDYQALILKFIEADKKYNARLFTQPYKEEIIENNQSVFWKIIEQLYYPESPYSFSVFASDILGNIYENFIAKKLTYKTDQIILQDKRENDDRDIVTTPVNIIHDILRETVVKYCAGKNDAEILSIKIADIACGSGAFLLETFQLLSDILIDYYYHNKPETLIRASVNNYKLPFKIKRQLLKNCIYGIDKDFNAVEAARFGLLLKLLEEETIHTITENRSILPDLSANLLFGNSLISFDNCPEGKEQEINPFNFDNMKFDIIIGNPPYMTTEEMKRVTPHELPVYKKSYISAFKQFDKYFLFIERCIGLLKENGCMGYIIPSKFTKVGAASKLRNLLIQKKCVSKIISFGANQIFSEKSNYTSLLFLRNSENATISYYEVKDYKQWILRDISNEEFDYLESKNLTASTWVLVPGYLKNCYAAILEQSLPLQKIIDEDNIYNGIQTSANLIYIHTPEKEKNNYIYFKKDGRQWKIEKELTRPYYKTSKGEGSLYTYRPFSPNAFVIYPYRKIKEKIEFIEIETLKESFPFAWEYLKHYQKILSRSQRDIKPEPMTENEWYRYGRHQSLDKCDVPAKIIVGVLSQGNKYAIDYYKTLISSGGTAGYCMITIPEKSEYSIYYIQALLTSKYLEWFSSLYGEIFRGGYIARGTKVLKQLPIRTINFSKEKELHDTISSTQKLLIEKQKELDDCANNPRLLTLKKREFSLLQVRQQENLKILYNLGDKDKKIPLISEIYGTH